MNPVDWNGTKNSSAGFNIKINYCRWQIDTFSTAIGWAPFFRYSLKPLINEQLENGLFFLISCSHINYTN